MEFNLKGKVAVVTGAGTGIGRAIAVELAKNGADVVIGGRREEKLQETMELLKVYDVRSMAIPTDVRVTAEMDNLVDTAVKEFGKLDIMVNNAGVCIVKPVMENTDEDFELIMKTNVGGTVHGTQAALRHMLPQKSGKIINISSMAGKYGWPMSSLYCASKAAVINYSDSVAKAVAASNINVNCVLPGYVPTAMADYIFETAAAMYGATPEQVQQAEIANVPLQRLVQPEDIANMVTFLASDAGSEITSQAISVTGGL